MPKRSLTVKRISSQEERKRPSQFIQLDTDEKFRGYALFDPDPEIDLDDNPGWFQYFDHWYQRGGFYYPCIGAENGCPLCKMGNFPYERAKTAWAIEDDNGDLEVKVFNFNSKLINEFTELLAEEREDSQDASLVGIEFRIMRTSDQGDYSTRPFWDNVLEGDDLDKIMEDIPDIEELIDRQLSQAKERADNLGALKDDDDDDDKPKSRSSSRGRGRSKDKDEEKEKPARGRGRGRSSAKDKDEEEEEKPARGRGRGRGRAKDKDEEEEEKPARGRGRRGSKDEEPEPEEEGPQTLDGEECTITKVDTKRETLTLENDDVGEFELFFGKDTEIDFEDYEKGDTVLVSAALDNEGDWVAADAPEKPKARGRGSRSRK